MGFKKSYHQAPNTVFAKPALKTKTVTIRYRKAMIALTAKERLIISGADHPGVCYRVDTFL